MLTIRAFFFFSELADTEKADGLAVAAEERVSPVAGNGERKEEEKVEKEEREVREKGEGERKGKLEARRGPGEHEEEGAESREETAAVAMVAQRVRVGSRERWRKPERQRGR